MYWNMKGQNKKIYKIFTCKDSLLSYEKFGLPWEYCLFWKKISFSWYPYHLRSHRSIGYIEDETIQFWHFSGSKSRGKCGLAPPPFSNWNSLISFWIVHFRSHTRLVSYLHRPPPAFFLFLISYSLHVFHFSSPPRLCFFTLSLFSPVLGMLWRRQFASSSLILFPGT